MNATGGTSNASPMVNRSSTVSATDAPEPIRFDTHDGAWPTLVAS